MKRISNKKKLIFLVSEMDQMKQEIKELKDDIRSINLTLVNVTSCFASNKMDHIKLEDKINEKL